MTTLPTMRLTPDGRSPDPHRRIAYGVDAVLTRVQLALETVRGTWIDDLLFGVPTDVWLHRPSTTSAEIEGTIRQVLTAVPGVTGIDSVTVTRRPVLTISASITVEADDERAAVQLQAVQSSGLDPAILAVQVASTTTLPLSGAI